LAEIAPGNFRGQGFVARRQKARFLPAAPMQCACGASADTNSRCTPLKTRVFLAAVALGH
jgi:hypothetical protein